MKKQTLFLIALIFSLTSFAQQPQKAGPNFSNRGDNRFSSLNLTPEQQEKIKTLRDTRQKNGFENRENQKFEREELFKMLASDASNKEIINFFNKQENEKNIKARERLDHLLAIREILTSQQRAKFFKQKDQLGPKDGKRKAGGWRMHNMINSDKEND